MSRELNRQTQASLQYEQAEKYWRRGKHRAAFPLFLAAAKGGLVAAFKIVGDFYTQGIGVRRNQKLAVYWYKRAYGHGNPLAANNIGCILRDKGRLQQAVRWFKRAIRLGDGDANLEIAKMYLFKKRHLPTAKRYLRETCKARLVTDGSIEEARSLLAQLRRGESRAQR